MKSNKTERQTESQTGYVYDERYMWHDTGNVCFNKWIQPFKHWENPETKRRFHNLIVVSGMYNKMKHIHPREANEKELEYFHTKRYINEIKEKSMNKHGNCTGDDVQFTYNGFHIATLAVGGIFAGLDSILNNEVENVYALIRPPGHHAIADQGLGFCVFNNIVLGAYYLFNKYNDIIKKIVIIDFDVHHGNGTESAFYNNENVLFISIHQAGNYPKNSGNINDIGIDKGKGSTINIPLPPGSGHEVYKKIFKDIIIPCTNNFKPDFIFVSSGLDGSFMDPLACMMLSSQSYYYMTKKLKRLARKICNGRLLFAHEGGYSEAYVPFCGLAIIEGLTDSSTNIIDPFLKEIQNWEYQDIQSHQIKVINDVISIQKQYYLKS